MTDRATLASLPAGLSTAADAAARGLERSLGGPRPAPSQTFLVGTRDGVRVEADAFLPAGRPPVAKLLVAPAMGVRRQFYSAFAAEMAAHGVATMTFDYRGIGGSRKGPVGEAEARLALWGEQDMAAATRELEFLLADDDPRHAKLPLLFVGHSIGGQLFGLMNDPPYRSALLVGAQSGHWRDWDGAAKAALAALWYVGVPALTYAFGYLPMNALGQGEDLPRGVAYDWARWGRHPAALDRRVAERPDAGYRRWAGKLRAIAIADDAYAPPRGVAALAGRYRAAERELVTVRPGDLGVKGVGHFGWFKSHFRTTLWADARRWLLASAGVNTSGSGPS
ncbi:MAG TPA: alpha/beta hydrolase [Polyangiaceae bacterium]|nr:alpha/beta hydrolase [Polyangiaceae bacterium]